MVTLDLNMQEFVYTIKSVYKKYNSNALIEVNRIQYFKYKVLWIIADTNYHQIQNF
jgi:hypothetical protein